MNMIAGIILFALLLEAVLNGLADYLNLKALRLDVPAGFENTYDPERYRLSQGYLRETTRFNWIVAGFDLLVLLGFWFGKGFYVLESWITGWQWGPVGSGIGFIGILMLVKAVLALPFGAYATFGIEARYGFNTMTVRTYIGDLLKGLGLTLVIGVPVLAMVLMFFEYAGHLAWLYCWIFTIILMLIIQYIFPAWIMPLFNRFEPLARGELRRAIFDYARQVKFPLKQIFVMDGSRRSNKSNAFFAGFGRQRRIVLFDTLIKRHSVDELVAIMAHEVGHYQKKHVLRNLLIGVLHAGFLFYLLSWVITYPALFEAFYLTRPTIHAGLIFFGLLYAPVEFVLGICLRALSRRYEYQADGFAVETTRDPDAMQAALKKLAANNLSNLTPHPFYTTLHYSHPPVLARVKAISRMGS
jgi:STE24 endopeptidase